VKLNQVSVDLQKLGDRLFKLVKHSTGAQREWQLMPTAEENILGRVRIPREFLKPADSKPRGA
jgi:hypothetical protein